MPSPYPSAVHPFLGTYAATITISASGLPIRRRPFRDPYRGYGAFTCRDPDHDRQGFVDRETSNDACFGISNAAADPELYDCGICRLAVALNNLRKLYSETDLVYLTMNASGLSWGYTTTVS